MVLQCSIWSLLFQCGLIYYTLDCSTAGCPFGESCHFLHYFPGGYNAVAQMMNLAPAVPAVSRSMAGPPAMQNGSTPAVKTRMCNKYNTAEGCKFGDKCHFAHNEWELGKPIAHSHDDPRSMGPITGRMGSRMEHPPPGPASSFGASATAKTVLMLPLLEPSPSR
ncbi:Zinc finger CCCH domain-containing protein 14 [Morella rubra]|uniref:Zinc finger CCCH domain-containing protein 14 n=1 Tax=Morella rubra TaxID=262757 RepID=A0A6A1WSB8_9ROSI|nr:Zinc finger CCCH domain-containing protein 14 [Morella rubra]